MAEPDRVRRLLGTLSRFRQDLGELAQVDEQRYVSERAYEGRYLIHAALADGLTDVDDFAHNIAQMIESEGRG